MKNQKSMMIGIAVVLVIVVAVILGTTGKKSDSSSTKSSTASSTPAVPDATATDAVAINNFAFGPKAVTVKVGMTVTWTNNDDVGHTVTADQESAEAPSSKTFNKGETYSFKFTKAGTYTYHCQPHPYMHGTVVVTQ